MHSSIRAIRKALDQSRVTAGGRETTGNQADKYQNVDKACAPTTAAAAAAAAAAVRTQKAFAAANAVTALHPGVSV
jgi:hypothetical protein